MLEQAGQRGCGCSIFWRCLRPGCIGPGQSDLVPDLASWQPCLWKGDWNLMALEGPSKLSHSMNFRLIQTDVYITCLALKAGLSLHDSFLAKQTQLENLSDWIL